MQKRDLEAGTLRIGKNLIAYEKTKTGWKKLNNAIPSLTETVKLFKAHNNFKELIDQKNHKFLKGQISPEGKIQGARIIILPNGEKLDKAYSIFAKNLTFHDESSHNHWDIIYQNPNGKYAYLYTQSKRNNAVKNKYKKVERFEKKYSLLNKNVMNALKDKEDIIALPMYTLLKTYMRVGNEMYYKANGHKGLTTLKKKDISISGNDVKFDYIAKSGVPLVIKEQFPKEYVKKLQEAMRLRKNNDFIFTNSGGHPLKDTDFMAAFEKYCGEEFYPHIVRSYYATGKAKEFLRSHKEATKHEIKELFNSIAEKLGHKRFDKKNNEWKDSCAVTVSHYIQPEIVEKVNNLVKS